MLPLWAFSTTPVLLALGAFLMQISVQGAWGVIPVHLNEISPDEIRATFPGLVYQLGNLIASVNGPLQASAAEAHGNNYALVMAVVIGIVAVVIAALIPFSRERRGIDMTQSAKEVATHSQEAPWQDSFKRSNQTAIWPARSRANSRKAVRTAATQKRVTLHREAKPGSKQYEAVPISIGTAFFISARLTRRAAAGRRTSSGLLEELIDYDP